MTTEENPAGVPPGGEDTTVEHLETSGTFSLDGGTWDVDNNVWIVGDGQECLIIDPAHDPDAVASAVGERQVRAILLTHGHDDHIRAVSRVAERVGAPVYLNPADLMLWEDVYPGTTPDEIIDDGQEFTIGRGENQVTLRAIHTPGHSPGSTCFYVPDMNGGVLFAGDTLFAGGPGATGRSYSDFHTIIASIRDKLFTLPGQTRVLPGHGEATTIAAEQPHLQEWIDRGY